MSEELANFLRDFLVGTTLDSDEVQGVNFTPYNDGAVLINIRGAANWHHIFAPNENMQFAQNRLESIPSAILPSRIASGDEV